MILSGSLYILGVSLLSISFYNSYMFAEDIYVSALGLVMLFYLFSLTFLTLCFKKGFIVFHERDTFLKLIFLHSFSSLSLLFTGEYSFTLFFQFMFLAVLINREIFFLIYLVALNHTSLLIFSSGLYILYLLDVFALLYLLYTKSELLNKESLWKFSVLLLITAVGFKIFEDSIFDLYIWLDLLDVENLVVSEVVYLLTLLHIIIFTFMIIQRKKALTLK